MLFLCTNDYNAFLGFNQIIFFIMCVQLQSQRVCDK